MSLERARSALIQRLILEVVEEAKEPLDEGRILEEVNKKLALWRSKDDTSPH